MELHYEVTGKLTDGITVSVFTLGGAYLYRVTFLAGNPDDTANEVISFFYRSCSGGTYSSKHGGNPHIRTITAYLDSAGYSDATALAPFKF